MSISSAVDLSPEIYAARYRSRGAWPDVLSDMGSLRWALVPDEALPLVIAGLGLLVIIGLLKPRRVVAMLTVIVGWLIAAPLLDVLVDLAPWWLLLLLIVALAMTVFRALASLLFGDAATDRLVAMLVADLIRAAVRLLFWPLRLLFARRH